MNLHPLSDDRLSQMQQDRMANRAVRLQTLVCAVETLKGRGEKFSDADVLTLAKRFGEYVYGVDAARDAERRRS